MGKAKCMCKCAGAVKGMGALMKQTRMRNNGNKPFNVFTFGNDPAEVPSKPHGLIDLVEHAMAHKVEQHLSGPVAVHCK